MRPSKHIILMSILALALVAAVTVARGERTGSKASASAVPRLVSLEVIPEGRKGPEGQLHDDLTVTDFRVVVGKPLTLHIDNTDTAMHSITSVAAGVDIIIQPGTHDYTLLVDRPGRFEWNCIIPCDPWAMERAGYMRGFITATTS